MSIGRSSDTVDTYDDMSIKLFTSTCWYHDWYCPYWHPHTCPAAALHHQ